MTFEDLPSDIRTTPLTDPQLRADLIDLIVGEEDREFGSIASTASVLALLPSAPKGKTPEKEKTCCNLTHSSDDRRYAGRMWKQRRQHRRHIGQ